jgi:hypothetical protein
LMLIGSDDFYTGDDSAAGVFGDAADGADGKLGGNGKNKRKQTHSNNQAGRSAHSGRTPGEQFFDTRELARET